MQTFESFEDARMSLKQRLYVKPDTAEEARLERALEDWLEEVDGDWRIKGVAAHPPLHRGVGADRQIRAVASLA